MARPFDEQVSDPQISSIASQTSLAGPPDAYGQSWSSKHLKKNNARNPSRPRLPKIKSSPGNGALETARMHHTRLHQRGKSTSATATSPTFVPDYLLQTTGASIPSPHAEPYNRVEKTAAKGKVKIKPLLRKFSSQEQVGIDLSRSAAENEGLGVYTSSEISTTPNRANSASTHRGYHHRTVSATSQLSTTTTSSHTRIGAQYVHPMRQTPRPYTPPIASYRNSLEGETPTGSLGDHLEHPTSPTPYAPLPTARRVPRPLHVRTTSSPLLNSPSQTNIPGTPSSLRFPTEVATPTMTSPQTARSSLESVFRKRSRSNTAADPVSQAATVQVLRQKFIEKEKAKDEKYAQKEQKKREKKEDDLRRASEKKDKRARTRSNAASEKSSLAAFPRDDQQPGNGYGDVDEITPTLNPMSPSVTILDGGKEQMPASRKGRGESVSAGKAVKSQWTLFWLRIRTMWFRLSRKMGG